MSYSYVDSYSPAYHSGKGAANNLLDNGIDAARLLTVLAPALNAAERDHENDTYTYLRGMVDTLNDYLAERSDI